MRATTLKIEDPLLDELEHLKPPHKSTTAFVKEILGKEIQRQKMIIAAEKYTEFLKRNPGERAWTDEWEALDLENPPRQIKMKRPRRK
jgi:hypothetical protein